VTDKKRLWHKRLNDFESFDRIELQVVPRYKTSGMSGDEWRQHVSVKFYFKGEVVHETGWNSMQNAMMMLPGEWARAQEPIPSRIIEMEHEGFCDQPSCPNQAEGRFRIKRETSERGAWLHEEESRYHDSYRQFCKFISGAEIVGAKMLTTTTSRSTERAPTSPPMSLSHRRAASSSR